MPSSALCTHLHSTESFGCDEADHLEGLAGQQAARLGPACAGDEAGLQAGWGGWRGGDGRGIAWGRETRPSWPKRMEPRALPPAAIATPPPPPKAASVFAPRPSPTPLHSPRGAPR